MFHQGDILFAKPIIVLCPRTPALHTGMNLLVCNMAVSDMVMSLTAAPLTPITSFTGRWFLGRIPCIILPACQVSGFCCLLKKKSFTLPSITAVMFSFEDK